MSIQSRLASLALFCVCTPGFAADYSDIPNWPLLVPYGMRIAVDMPSYPVFSVKDYGAKGDGVADDTPAIRKALAAAQTNRAGIVYLPRGKYAVCPQPGDANPTGVIFPVTSSNIVFTGDGPFVPDKYNVIGTALVGYCAGLKDPVKNWTVNAAKQVNRFGMFSVVTKTAPLSGIQFRSMTVDGQCPYTGNSTVGGIPATGDGWDMSHKAIVINGSKTIDKVLIFNCDLCNWRGEIIYAGGNSPRKVWMISSKVRSTNASAVSCSADLFVHSSQIGGTTADDDVYNAFECMALAAPQKVVVQNSTITCSSNAEHPHGWGVAYLGYAGTSLLLDQCQVTNCHGGILFSEAAHNVTVQGCTFTNNINGMITSILGLYPKFPSGFSSFLIQNSTFDQTGAAFISQTGRIPNFVFRRNSILRGIMIDGNHVNKRAPSTFLIDACTLTRKATGTWFGYSGELPLMANMVQQSDGSVIPQADGNTPTAAAVR